MSFVVQTLLALGMKLLTAAALEDLLLFVSTKVVEHTDTVVDDEFLDLVKKHLNKE